MKIFSLMLVKRILLVSTLLVSISISRQLDIKAIAPRSIYKSLHDQVYSREFHSIEDLNTTRDDLIELRRRGEFLLSSVSAGDATILRQAFVDMLELVNFVAMNPNPRIFQRYFDPQYVADVNAIFATVRDMAADGGIPRPANGAKKVRPYDISEITILRGEGKLPNVAFSLNTRPQPANDDPQTITVTSFGWGALWRLLRGDLECGRDIGPKVDYKMHFLGSLLFHEVLHFENVPVLAWGRARTDSELLDDQPGAFPCLSKAYGPYESIQLRQRDPAKAKLNIENYVWYALETFWVSQCPQHRNALGVFTAPTSNDIPALCRQANKGFWRNLWCFASGDH